MTAEQMRGLERSTDPPLSDGGQAGNTSPDCLPGTRKLPSMNLGERPGPTAWSQALVHREPGQRSCEQCPVRTRKRPALRLHRDSPPTPAQRQASTWIAAPRAGDRGPVIRDAHSAQKSSHCVPELLRPGRATGAGVLMQRVSTMATPQGHPGSSWSPSPGPPPLNQNLWDGGPASVSPPPPQGSRVWPGLRAMW